ncbi:Alcohol-forming fatty acyl-CoA reductase-like protein [Drosera capensis]
MEFGSINQFLDGKTFLVTGATGFIAKIFVEKLLRVQPNLKKLYLLVRAKDNKSAADRLKHEIVGKELFDVLRGEWGKDFDSLISQKMIAIAGDSTYENLGISDYGLREEMWKEVDVVVNVAATTKFYDRYDVAFNTNTLGALHVLNFAKKCEKIQLLLHVSTAYVCGEKTGIVSEKPFDMGEPLRGTSQIDIDAETKLINENLEDLKINQASENRTKKILRDLGHQRAKRYGWPNVYVFTKAMGEMLINRFKGNLPVVILRPTIVTSTYKEPIPGWIEGVRMLDAPLVAYGKGKLNILFGEGNSILDLIPADMVVNAMIIATVAHANNPFSMAVYQLGTSFRNPVTLKMVHDILFRYFTEKPWTNKEGRRVIIQRGTVLGSLFVFQIFLWLLLFVVKVLRLVDTVSSHQFQSFVDNLYTKITVAMKLVEIYKPFLSFKGIFEDVATEELRVAARRNGVDETRFFFDPKLIDWNDYFLGVHIPAAIRLLF